MMEGEGNTEVGAIQRHGQEDLWAKTTVACLRCREQKLGCNRELPSCARCLKQKAVCKYPPPPDRRRIALKAKPSKAKASGQPAEQTQQPPPEPATIARLGKRQRLRDHAELQEGLHTSPNSNPNTNSSPDSGMKEEDFDLPPSEVGVLLLEIYFKRAYNASLLFHKLIAFQLYEQNGIPDYLLRAIFAQAAVFLQQVPEDSPYKKSINIFPLHAIFEKSWAWARSASREVLSHIDEPTLVRVQALQVLHLYYFSRGSTQRALVHGSLAYQLCQVLGYDRLHDDMASATRGLDFDQEIKRRCFWASWASLRIGYWNPDHCKTLEELHSLPLPVRLGSLQGVELTLCQKIEVDWKLSASSNMRSHECLFSSRSSSSIMAELIKLLGVWSHVQAFLTEPPGLTISQRTMRLEKLLELFDPIELSLELPLVDICARAEFYNESPELLTSLCSMYYISRLLVHVSMVLRLSGSTFEPADLDQSDLVEKHTNAALCQATNLLNILQQFVSKDLDITRLWHFTGYGAFVAGSIFVVYQNRTQVPQLDSTEMKIIQKVLQVLSIYWEPLRGLAIKLDEMINTGQYTTVESIISLAFSWERFRPRPLSEDNDDTISVPNNLSTNPPLFQMPNARLVSEDYQFRNIVRNEGNTEPHQSLLEQQQQQQEVHPAQTWAAPPLLEDPFETNYEAGMFDVIWGNAQSTINIWAQAMPSSEIQ